MNGVLWTDAPYGFFTFVLITLILGGAGAFATGRAMARTWRPLLMLAPYMVFLTAYVWTFAIGALGYRSMRAGQMATQYSWAYEQAGLNWRAKGGA